MQRDASKWQQALVNVDRVVSQVVRLLPVALKVEQLARTALAPTGGHLAWDPEQRRYPCHGVVHRPFLRQAVGTQGNRILKRHRTPQEWA
jgi:hypothetical protein